MRYFCYFVILLTISLSCKKEKVEPDNENNDPIIINPIDVLPSIGVYDQPSTGDSICPINYYVSQDFDSNALAVGSQVPDFTLYTIHNKAVTLSEVLKDKKPVFLMTGSYTCPTFRDNISNLNNLVYDFGNDINFFLAYTVEAHPTVNPSPYSGSLWTTNANSNEGILYQQPKIYAHRLSIINDMLLTYTIHCDILVDGPCNEFWYGYGEAPNRAYLIDTTGQVIASHGWFDYETMVTSIEYHLSN